MRNAVLDFVLRTGIRESPERIAQLMSGHVCALLDVGAHSEDLQAVVKRVLEVGGTCTNEQKAALLAAVLRSARGRGDDALEPILRAMAAQRCQPHEPATVALLEAVAQQCHKEDVEDLQQLLMHYLDESS
jgi:hypothetical protein